MEQQNLWLASRFLPLFFQWAKTTSTKATPAEHKVIQSASGCVSKPENGVSVRPCTKATKDEKSMENLGVILLAEIMCNKRTIDIIIQF